MKKLTALLLAIVMIMSLAACAGGTKETNTENTETAENADNSDANAAQDGDVWNAPNTGVSMKQTELLKNLKGTAELFDYGEVGYDEGIFYCSLEYYTMPQTQYDQIMEKYDNDTVTDEEMDLYHGAYHEIFEVFAIDGGRGADELTEFLAMYEVATDGMEEIGKSGDYTFFYLPTATEDEAEDMGEYAEEFKALMADKDAYIANMTISEPAGNQFSAAEEGAVIDFDTTDLDGNPVSMADIFAQHDVTMINIWATWCGPCVNEMPELAELNREFGEKNCAIVGILMDDTDEATLADAKDILANAGADFTVVVAPETMRDTIPVDAYPTSYFVDSQGRIVGKPVVGAYTDAYAERMDEAIAAIGE